MTAQAIMILGTSSHVGKSLLTAALCRIFADAGISVAPFKAQNMSLNSAATVEGLEIGRAQALQAEAARIPASVHMNPVLLKPSGEMSSQVVVRGRIWGNVSAANYHLRRVEELMPLVRESYETLASQHEVILLEGAGSPAEINLKQHDIVNMRMASLAKAACMLVGDIDRGGVFASLYGTIALLEPEEHAMIRGFVINKFRGDLGLLTPGIRMIEERLQKRCLGTVPWLSTVGLDEEDSVGLFAATQEPWRADAGSMRCLQVAVIAVPSFSNFTDFDALSHEPSVDVRFCRTPAQLVHADVVILPGSKQTAADLVWMRAQHLDDAIKKHASRSLVAGICGGMQMLGRAILDPAQVEYAGDLEGLGLLPFETRMNATKVTRQISGRLGIRSLFNHPLPPTEVIGYEIHVGETTYAPEAIQFAVLGDGSADGCVSSDSRIFGTYLHGIFDDDAFRHTFLMAARSFHGLAPATDFNCWKQLREAALNRLADAVRNSLDLGEIFSWVGKTYSLRRVER